LSHPVDFKIFEKSSIFVGMMPAQYNNEKLVELCKRHHVKELYLFGSILTNKFMETSDVDLLVQFGNMDIDHYFDNYMDFKDELEDLFNRPVDLVENQAIKNPVFRKVVDREKQLVYEREDS
jgi:predicted nucleotidyltransferase